MLIHDSGKGWTIQQLRLLALFLVLLLFSGLGGYYFWQQNQSSQFTGFICNAERTDKSADNHIYFKTRGIKFYNGHTQSDQKARTGKYSCKLSGENKFGIRYDLTNPEQGKFYHASVWRYQSGTRSGMLIASNPSGELLYKTMVTPTVEDQNGWDRLDLKFFIPFHQKPEVIRVYVFSSGEGEVFFDDFQLREVAFEQDSVFSNLPVERLDIKVNDTGYKKLKAKRDKAFNKGILKSSDDDWVKGVLETPGHKQLEIKLRLKGDFLDHLQNDKWSFRIKVKDPGSWNGLKTFSIQHPATREFLKEWFFHQVLEKEGLLSTSYDFASVRFNDRELGIYTWEEHFDKQLVESRNRREGPILRFSEDAYFDAIGKDFAVFGKDLNKGDRNETEASEILPFNENKILLSPELKKQFEAGRDLVEAFKYNTRPPEEIFDLDKIAKFFAIVDLTQAYHSIVWHNLRFYFNPVIGKLEPVAFDGFGIGLKNWKNRPFFGHGVFHPDFDGLEMYKNLFHDKVFMAKYLEYLNAFTSSSYLQNLMLNLESGIQEREKIIQREFPGNKFDRQSVLVNALKINELLIPVHESALLAFPATEKKDSLKLLVSNTTFLPLELVGTGYSDSEIRHRLVENVWINADKKWSVPEQVSVTVPKTSKFIFYRIPGIDTILTSRIKSVQANVNSKPSITVKALTDLVSNKIFIIDNQSVSFNPGKHTVEQSIVIPKGKKVIIPAGCELDLINGAAILSYSPVTISGREGAPVVIGSSDGNNGGFSVFQSKGKSKLHYTIFQNLDDFSILGQTTTGAVNFYEADVDISNCSFTGNQCEDALNIIRSEFNMVNSTISDTYGDGLDADFCKGAILNCRFINTTNDGLDLSGSVIEIKDCLIKGTGDKGISVGERSTVKIHSAKVLNSPVGIASKDLSETQVDFVELENCTHGFSAYQKKPEFGGAKIRVDDYKAINVKSLFLTEKGSEIIMPK